MWVNGMKSINVTFSNEQCEALEDISKLCQKDAPDFIREALICLLPLQEYVEAKHNLIELSERFDAENSEQVVIEATNNIQNIHNSAMIRLKRLGIIQKHDILARVGNLRKDRDSSNIE